MTRPRKRSLHEHLMAIGVAVVVVAAVSVGINRSWLLTADIGGGGYNTSAASADISYAIADNSLSIDSEKSFQGAQSLSFMLVYNPESTHPNIAAIETSYDYTSSSWNEGVIHVTIFLSGTMAPGEHIARIPLTWTGDTNDVTLSDATMLFTWWAVDTLAIGRQ